MDNATPLFSLEAEHAVLGAMMIRPELIDSLTEDISGADFFRAEHKIIFDRITELHADHGQIDVITVSDNLQLPGHEFALAYVAEIAHNTPSVANAYAYAKIVAERAVRRRMLAAAQDIQDLAQDEGDLQECIATANALIAGIEAPTSGAEAVLAREIMLKQTAIWEERHSKHVQGVTFSGLSTGITDLDKVLNGLRPGQLVVVGGRPGNGKTTLAMGMALHAAVELEKSALVFSLEMSESQLMDRMTASVARVDLGTILDGSALSNPDSTDRMMAAASKFSRCNLSIVDRGNLNINVIRSAARKVKHARGLDLVVIDYLQLMNGTGGKRNENRNEEISIISRGAKLLARELDVPVLLLSQLNRDNTKTPGHDSRPKISHLRDSGSIEQDADVVILVHRQPTDDDKPTELIVGKNRDGQTGTVPAAFLGKYNRFENLSSEAMQEFYADLHASKTQPAKTGGLTSRYAK